MTVLLVAWFVISAFNVVYGFLRARQRGFKAVTIEDGYWQGVFTAGVVSLVIFGIAGLAVALGTIH